MATAFGQGVMSLPVRESPQAQARPLKGVRGWLALWCFGGLVFHLLSLLDVFASKPPNLSSEAVNLVVGGLSAFGVYAAVCVLLSKPYALRLVFLNFLQWAVLLVLTYPVIFLTLNPGSTLAWKGIGMFIVAMGVPWMIWFRYFKVSKRVLATFGRNM